MAHSRVGGGGLEGSSTRHRCIIDAIIDAYRRISTIIDGVAHSGGGGSVGSVACRARWQRLRASYSSVANLPVAAAPGIVPFSLVFMSITRSRNVIYKLIQPHRHLVGTVPGGCQV